MAEVESRDILKDYYAVKDRYCDFCIALENLIVRLLKANGVRVHLVDSRCKSLKSLEGKIGKIHKRYRSLEDITDLSGLRVTTYFASDIDRVAKIIAEEFIVDDSRSIDKRKNVDPEKFGYASLHLIARLKIERAAMKEYFSFSTMVFEIQIRSILQHAWAEIEHDLGYKRDGAMPDLLTRKFARIAALMELADDEFENIREDIRAIPDNIDRAPETVPLNILSLRALYEKPSQLRTLDEQIAARLGEGFVGDSAALGEHDIERLAYFKITNVAQLEDIIADESPSVIDFAVYWINVKCGSFYGGCGLFCLYLYLASKAGVERLKEYLFECRIGDPNDPVLLAKILSYRGAI